MNRVERALIEIWYWVEIPVLRLDCLIKGHNWDSERPSGPLGFDPDRCWRCEKTR